MVRHPPQSAHCRKEQQQPNMMIVTHHLKDMTLDIRDNLLGDKLFKKVSEKAV